jgi:hypothetical protein
VLNVAEKNDVAKNISEILSRGRYNRRDGASQYNKIYEFPYQVYERDCHLSSLLKVIVVDLDPNLLAGSGSGKNHSESGQLWIRMNLN